MDSSNLKTERVNKRLQKELGELRNLNPQINCMVIDEHDIYHLKATIQGPEGTPYENGLFDLDIRVPQEYPFKPPKVRFETKILHLNINNKGEIGLELLYDRWTPRIKIENILLEILSLMSNPNNAYLITDDFELYDKNPKLFNIKAKEWTQRWALRSTISSPEEQHQTTTALVSTTEKDQQMRSERVVWFWKSNLNPWSTIEADRWEQYSDDEILMLEKAVNNNQQCVYLNDYIIDLENGLHTNSSDDNKVQRPIKRLG
ncbi:unnamed protein product [Didymodactylos carnosus]|uniref:UBC core domain-containing protein n=1 Tax=Didymodactylos carnosus TaxID=1234261 RepID=A0A815HYV1_9BILA|nr:unnamed protein product [Didymodactylos carnosus]CAF1399443.1 unnamed protein product [Didymodactylos carnosus]CAF4206943.1 unnamed protein product [Didymodactylos carnosus]CAF4233937.1 unnamed protein product [Didymodactylos carnosus]